MNREQMESLQEAWENDVSPRTIAAEVGCTVRCVDHWYAHFDRGGEMPDPTRPWHNLKPRPPVPMPANPNAYPDVVHKLKGRRA
jgi:hypothetical protein